MGKLEDMVDKLVKARVLTMNEDDVTAVVCMRDVGQPRIFPDDIDTVCAKCGHAIFHRPHMPVKPPKICMECSCLMVEEDET